VVQPLPSYQELAASYLVDLVQIIGQVSADIDNIRANRKLPPLRGAPAGYAAGSILVGKEWVHREQSPPRIVLVPTDIRLEPARMLGLQPSQQVSALPLRSFYFQRIMFDAHIWGDPDPAGANPLYDFNTAFELYRELVGAFYRNLGGAPSIIAGGARWEQPTDDRRLGRLLIAEIGFYNDLTDEPYVLLPYSTATSPGVQVVETLVDETSGEQVGPIVAPP
jgi:hypothetical protein